MKNKYRIKQVGNTYYPQKKVLFFWKYLDIPKCYICKYEHEIILYDNTIIRLSGNSLESAINKINEYDTNYLKPFVCCNFLIATYIDEESDVYYYAASDTLFSDSSEQLCEKISEYKRKQKESKNVTIHEYSKN